MAGRAKRGPMAVLAAAFCWARYTAWSLLGAGFLVLIASAAWSLGWGPVAVALIVAGYCVGVIAVLPIVGRSIRAAVAALRRSWASALSLLSSWGQRRS
jgi:hypothetical protein